MVNYNKFTKYRSTIVHEPGQLDLCTVYTGFISGFNVDTKEWEILYSISNDFKFVVLFNLWRMMKKVKKIAKWEKELEGI